MIVYTTVTTDHELQQILELQQENLPTAISEETQKTEGFVTVHHSFDLLDRMNKACPHIIAKNGEKVVGYALCMHPKFGDEIEVLRPMFKEIGRVIKDPSTTRQDESFGLAFGVTMDEFIVMGQVCIHKDFRKQGIFRKLYDHMLKEISPGFKAIITEVDRKNTRSLEAHYAIGFRTLSRYNSDGKDWELIVLT